MKAPLPNSLDWQRIVPYLDRALDLAPVERNTWLDELTTTEPEIAQAVRDLLLERDRADSKGFLDKSPLIQPNPLLGQKIGAYTVSRPLGRGGMGEVWLAIRNDGRFEGQCAIKLLDASSVSPKLVDRFRTEGQALARLTHANIARLIDAGSTAEGRPYLAIEYVDGERIDRYCDSRSFSIDERVRLFLNVVAAVAHAHSQLVIHRDLKPSNVFVTKDGTVKLLDFGIAKLLSADTVAGDSTLTRAEDAALTPEYAAPEQILGEPPTTATDVYQLGLLLFVLLTGKHPVAFDGSRAERMRAALDGPVPQASEFADAAHRKKLRGDLDAIVAKALRKLPSERYATAQAFRDELLRYLNHEPIQARRGASWYRARKFIARHRVLVGATCIVLATLGTGLLVVNRERLVAERRFSQLRTLSGKIFDLDEKIRELPGSTEARQAIVAVSLQYLDGLAADASSDTQLALQVGDAYRRVGEILGVPIMTNLGETTKADENLKKAEELMLKGNVAQSRDAKLLDSFMRIAVDRMILAETEQRDGDALIYAEAALTRAEFALQAAGDDVHNRATIGGMIDNIALTYNNLHQYDKAAAVARRAIEVAQGATGHRNVDTISVGLSVLSNALRGKGDLDGALTAINESKRIAERGSYASELHRMAELYGVYLREARLLGEYGGVNLNRATDAIDVYQKAFDVVEKSVLANPKDYGSRSRLGGAARGLGILLRDRDPTRSLVAYDAAIKALAEVPNNNASRRNQAEFLAGSSYPLVSLHRNQEAQARIETALSTMNEIHELPSDTVSADSALFSILTSQAEFEARSGRKQPALELSLSLLTKVHKDEEKASDDLWYAARIDPLYASITTLHEQLGNHAEAVQFANRRLNLWRSWNEKLSGNAFAKRELDAANRDARSLDRH